MHYHLYPNSDAYITNNPKYILNNFGGSDSLVISVKSKPVLVNEALSIEDIDGDTSYINLSNFNGVLIGGECGVANFITGSVYECFNCSYNFYLSNLTANATSSVYFSSSILGIGGFIPYIYNITSGSLPLGLQFTQSNNTASISGTPTGSGQYTFILNVQDTNLCSDSNIYNLFILPNNYWILI